MLPGALSLPVWLLLRGVDLRKWEVAAATKDLNLCDLTTKEWISSCGATGFSLSRLTGNREVVLHVDSSNDADQRS